MAIETDEADKEHRIVLKKLFQMQNCFTDGWRRKRLIENRVEESWEIEKPTLGLNTEKKKKIILTRVFLPPKTFLPRSPTIRTLRCTGFTSTGLSMLFFFLSRVCSRSFSRVSTHVFVEQLCNLHDERPRR